MGTKKQNSEKNWVDPDDAPHLTKEWFEQADLYRGDTLIRRGRPKAANPKEAVNIRLDADVINHFRASAAPAQAGKPASMTRCANWRGYKAGSHEQELKGQS